MFHENDWIWSGFVPLLIVLLSIGYVYFPNRYEFIPETSQDELHQDQEKYGQLITNSIRRSARGKLCLVGLELGLVLLFVWLSFDLKGDVNYAIHAGVWTLLITITAINRVCEDAVLKPSRYQKAFRVVLYNSFFLFLIYLERSLGLMYYLGFSSSLPIKWDWIPVGLVTLTAINSKMVLNEARYHRRLLLNDRSCKEINASLFYRWTFSFIDDLIAIGYEKPLEFDDLDELLEQDTSKASLGRFKTISKPNRSLLTNLFFLVWKEFVWQQLATLVSVVTVIGSPWLLRLILLNLENKESFDLQKLLFYALVLFCVSMTRSMSDGQLYFLGRRIGIRVRSVIIALVYEKSLKRIAKSEVESGSGKVTNLMSVDAFKVLDACCYFMYVWGTPLQAIVFVAFLVQVAGYAGLAGLAVMITLIPLGGALGKVIQKKQKELMAYSDNRISAANEMLQGIRIVKFFAWETQFEKKLEKLRTVELQTLWNYVLLNSCNKIVWEGAPVLVSFFTFFTLTIFSGKELSISTAFTCLSIFQSLERPLREIPDIVVKLMEAEVSLKRVEDYINKPELDEYINTKRSVNHKDFAVEFLPESKFQWHKKPESNEDTPSYTFSVMADFAFPKGKLSVIYGATGAGKSSLLSSILGELQCMEGGLIIEDGIQPKQSIPIAYVSQHVWLQNATIKENILFGSLFNPQRYNLTIECCALVRDFETLIAGDMTEVGEKGINLSGGQKARISLARAIYSSASVILLDDVLSAVDAPTAKHLFEQAICGPLVKNRTRILVTHAIHLCLPRASMVVQMTGGKGTVCDNSSIKRLESSSFVFEDEYPSDEELEEKKTHKIIKEESRVKGSVSAHVYWTYCREAGGYGFIALLVATYGGTQAMMLTNDIWIKYWADAFRRNEGVEISFYAYMYAAIGISVMVMLFLRVYVVARGSLQASHQLHQKLTKKILRAPVRFFETTPVGRIINRFSKDIKDIDLELAFYAGDFLANLVRVLFFLAVIMTVNPYSLIGLIPVGIIYTFVGQRYLAAARELKRLDSNSRSPIFSHFGESLSGSATIRAYARESNFIEQLHKNVDKNHQAFSLLWNTNRWIGVRIDLVGALIALLTNLTVIFTSYIYGGVDAGFAGLSIAYSLGFTSALLWLVRKHALMEMEMNAVERIEEYLELEEEAPAIIQTNRPDPSWPHKGEIKIQDLTLRYSPTGPAVLSNISFSVKPGEKVGIVGRTGAGKTTLSLAFFRFIEPQSGTIFIDGIDISKIGVYDLRSKLTVIPQDPVLFSGTLRSNLDPFGDFEDQELWNSLRVTHFLESMQIYDNEPFMMDGVLNNQSISLDSQVSEGGSNFSQGQRQLLCLARAILKQFRVIILDEATASIDHSTDTKIQQTIRDMFTNSTLLCIAHRLSTIMDYDKILVLEKGSVVQFGTPLELIEASGIFKDMCKESNEYDKLYRIASLRNFE